MLARMHTHTHTLRSAKQGRDWTANAKRPWRREVLCSVLPQAMQHKQAMMRQRLQVSAKHSIQARDRPGLISAEFSGRTKQTRRPYRESPVPCATDGFHLQDVFPDRMSDRDAVGRSAHPTIAMVSCLVLEISIPSAPVSAFQKQHQQPKTQATAEETKTLKSSGFRSRDKSVVHEITN